MSALKVEDDYIASIPLSRRLQTKASVSVSDDSLQYPPSFASPGLLGMADEQPILHARRRRASSSSSRSSLSRASLTCPSPQLDDEDAWNLIPYNVPWGPDYYAYKSGTLPGPGGKCVFLRSPTPLKNQRTTQACKKCRERKAKCSGTRPTCNRCSARGHACIYEDETPRVKRGAVDRRKHRKISPGSNVRDNDHYDEAASNTVVSQDTDMLQSYEALPSHSESFPDTSSESFPDTSSVDSWAEDEIDYNYALVSNYPSTGEPYGNNHYVHAPQPLRQNCAPLLHEATGEGVPYCTDHTMFAPSYFEQTSPMTFDHPGYQNVSYESQHYVESYLCHSASQDPQGQTYAHLSPSFPVGAPEIPHGSEAAFAHVGGERSLGNVPHLWVPV